MARLFEPFSTNSMVVLVILSLLSLIQHRLDRIGNIIHNNRFHDKSIDSHLLCSLFINLFAKAGAKNYRNILPDGHQFLFCIIFQMMINGICRSGSPDATINYYRFSECMRKVRLWKNVCVTVKKQLNNCLLQWIQNQLHFMSEQMIHFLNQGV